MTSTTPAPSRSTMRAEFKSKIGKLILPERIGAARKVMLIVPPGSTEESYGRLSSAAGELPMLGLAFIAASLREQGHEVRVCDYEVHRDAFETFRQEFKDFQPDVIGMTVYVTNMKRCAAVAEEAKKIKSDTFVVLGGPQVSIFPEDGMACPAVDICVLSEGEVVIRNVMNALHTKAGFAEVAGVVWRDSDGKIIKNDREKLVDDLDILPRPALDLYDMKKYYPAVHVRGRKVGHILTSRGCPFQCTFCETKLTFGRTFRYHSAKRVIDEVEALIKDGYDSVQFYDDIFTVNKKRVRELCEGFIERGLKFQWMCWTRTNCVDPETLDLMKRAGCYLLVFGAETADDELLDLIKKDLTVEVNYEGIRLAREAGLLTQSSFMLGLPRETSEQTMKTIQFAIDSGLDYALFPITEPYPGTELWEDAKQYGTFDHSGTHQNNLLSEAAAVWIPHGRTREELNNMAQLAMRKFYWRPRQIFQTIRNFWYLPPRRILKLIWAAFSYFGLNMFKPSEPGSHY